MKQWDKIYKREGQAYATPLYRLPRLVKQLKKRQAKRILDLGCGSGKHLLYLAQKGFEVYGIDYSPEAIRHARVRMKKAGMKAILDMGSIHEKLPYKDNFFDGVISIRVLNHGGIREIRNAIGEIERVLKPRGLVFVVIIKKFWRKKPFKLFLSRGAKLVGPRTYVPTVGEEAGVVHFLFSKKILKQEFKKFEILDFWVECGRKKWERFYCLLGELT